MTITRVTFGPAHMAGALDQQGAAPIPENIPPASRVHGGTVSYTAGQSEAAQTGVARYVHSTEGTTGGSVAATLDRRGNSLTVELEPGNPATRTLVSQAVRMGLLEEHQPGKFRDMAPAQDANTHEQEPEPQEVPKEDPGAGLFLAEEDQLWAQEIEPLPQFSYDAAVSSVIGAVVAGAENLDRAALGLARSAGIDPAKAAEYVEAGYAMHERVVARAVAPLGIVGDERKAAFYAACRENTQRFQDAVQRLVHMRDASGFKELAQDFRRRNPGPEVAQMKAAGFETSQDPQTGETLVRHGGGEWRPLSAVLQGSGQ